MVERDILPCAAPTCWFTSVLDSGVDHKLSLYGRWLWKLKKCSRTSYADDRRANCLNKQDLKNSPSRQPHGLIVQGLYCALPLTQFIRNQEENERLKVLQNGLTLASFFPTLSHKSFKFLDLNHLLKLGKLKLLLGNHYSLNMFGSLR